MAANRALRLSLRGTHPGGLALVHGDLKPENTGAQLPLGSDLVRSQAGRPLDSDRRGQLLWKFETGSSVYSSPAIVSDVTVYVGSETNKVYALDGKSGAKKWEFETGEWKNYFGRTVRGVSSSPVIASDGAVYVGSRDKNVYALRIKSKGLAKSPWPMRG